MPYKPPQVCAHSGCPSRSRARTRAVSAAAAPPPRSRRPGPAGRPAISRKFCPLGSGDGCGFGSMLTDCPARTHRSSDSRLIDRDLGDSNAGAGVAAADAPRVRVAGLRGDAAGTHTSRQNRTADPENIRRTAGAGATADPMVPCAKVPGLQHRVFLPGGNIATTKQIAHFPQKSSGGGTRDRGRIRARELYRGESRAAHGGETALALLSFQGQGGTPWRGRAAALAQGSRYPVR